MGDWSLFPGIANSTSMGGVQIASHATANTKGNYAQLTASLPIDVHFITISPDYADGPYDFLFDIAIGAAGSEQIIISNLTMCTLSGLSYRAAVFYAPIFIPAGTRIAIRSQSSTGNKNAYINITGYALDFMKNVLSPPLTYGANTADSGGTPIDAGAAAYTRGAYAQLVASTTRVHFGVILGFGNIINTGRSVGIFQTDLAIGAAASEIVIVSDVPTGTTSSQPPSPAYSMFYPVKIPVGSRLAVRCSSGITDGTDRLLDVIAYCF